MKATILEALQELNKKKRLVEAQDNTDDNDDWDETDLSDMEDAEDGIFYDDSGLDQHKRTREDNRKRRNVKYLSNNLLTKLHRDPNFLPTLQECDDLLGAIADGGLNLLQIPLHVKHLVDKAIHTQLDEGNPELTSICDQAMAQLNSTLDTFQPFIAQYNEILDEYEALDPSTQNAERAELRSSFRKYTQNLSAMQDVLNYFPEWVSKTVDTPYKNLVKITLIRQQNCSKIAGKDKVIFARNNAWQQLGELYDRFTA